MEMFNWIPSNIWVGVGIAFAPPHVASMTNMAAACIASAGSGMRNGTAATMTMYPVVPDYQRFPDTGRNKTDTFGEMGLAGHWIKYLLPKQLPPLIPIL